MPLPSVEALTTVAGAAVVVSLLFEVLKRAIRPSPDVLDRFGALAAMALGVVVVLVASFVLGLIGDGASLVAAILNGISAGLMAIGMFKTVDNLASS